VICLPKIINTAEKIAIASRKLAIGPAATMAARWPTPLWKKLRRLSSWLIASRATWSGTLAAFSSPKNLT
jgi:hypothetical protein